MDSRSSIKAATAAKARALLCAAAISGTLFASAQHTPRDISDETYEPYFFDQGYSSLTIAPVWASDLDNLDPKAFGHYMIVMDGCVHLLIDGDSGSNDHSLKIKRFDAGTGDFIDERTVEYPAGLAKYGKYQLSRHAFTTDSEGNIVAVARINQALPSNEESYTLTYAALDLSTREWGDVRSAVLKERSDEVNWIDFFRVLDAQGDFMSDTHSFRVPFGMISGNASGSQNGYIRFYDIASSPTGVTVTEKDTPALVSGTFSNSSLRFTTTHIDEGVYMVEGGAESRKYGSFVIRETDNGFEKLEESVLPTGVRGFDTVEHGADRILLTAASDNDKYNESKELSFRMGLWKGYDGDFASSVTELWNVPSRPFARPEGITVLDHRLQAATEAVRGTSPLDGSASTSLYLYSPSSGLARYELATSATGTSVSAAVEDNSVSIAGRVVSVSSPADISVYTPSGSLILSRRVDSTLDLSGLASGLYILRAGASVIKFHLR